jgi:hypothetical protein
MDYGNFCAGSIPGLTCKDFGPSPEQALAAVRERALEVLKDYEAHNMTPSAPPRLTLQEVELPAPMIHRSHTHLSAVQDAGGPARRP